MNYPRSLVPSASEPFKLDDGRVVEVPKPNPEFSVWPGSPPGDTFGGKAILDFNGRPAFAELAILLSFHKSGWDGVCVDSFRSRYLRGSWPAPLLGELPADQKALLERIVDHASGKAKPWGFTAIREALDMLRERKRETPSSPRGERRAIHEMC